MFTILLESTKIGAKELRELISDYLFSCTQYREAQKSRWLTKCIEELKTNSSWVLPALKQIREICCLYQEAPHNTAPSAHHTQRQVSKFSSASNF